MAERLKLRRLVAGRAGLSVQARLAAGRAHSITAPSRPEPLATAKIAAAEASQARFSRLNPLERRG
jgi:hypothetical protein